MKVREKLVDRFQRWQQIQRRLRAMAVSPATATRDERGWVDLGIGKHRRQTVNGIDARAREIQTWTRLRARVL